MKLFSKIFVGISSLFKSCEASNMDVFFAMPNFCNERLLLKRFSVNYTLAAKFVSNLGVCLVLPISRFSQIVNSVVTLIAVDMINLVRGPLSCTIEPSQSVSSVMLPINLKVNVPLMMKIPRLLTDANFWSWCVPKEQPSIFFISKNAKKLVVTNFFHDGNLTRFAGFARGSF